MVNRDSKSQLVDEIVVNVLRPAAKTWIFAQDIFANVSVRQSVVNIRGFFGPQGNDGLPVGFFFLSSQTIERNVDL